MEQMKSLFESTEPKYGDDPWENFKMSPLFNLGTIAEKRIPQDKPKTSTADYTCAEVVRNLQIAGKTVLTLPFDEKRISISEVINRQKLETRLIYPKNQQLYLEHEVGVPKKYDFLYLKGKVHGAVVENLWLKTEVVNLVDDFGNQIYERNWDGLRYEKRAIEYHIGKVIKYE